MPSYQWYVVSHILQLPCIIPSMSLLVGLPCKCCQPIKNMVVIGDVPNMRLGDKSCVSKNVRLDLLLWLHPWSNHNNVLLGIDLCQNYPTCPRTTTMIPYLMKLVVHIYSIIGPHPILHGHIIKSITNQPHPSGNPF